jgi:hypothetical protein
VVGLAAFNECWPVERVAAVGATRRADEREHLEGLQLESEFYREPEFWLGLAKLGVRTERARARFFYYLSAWAHGVDDRGN